MSIFVLNLCARFLGFVERGKTTGCSERDLYWSIRIVTEPFVFRRRLYSLWYCVTIRAEGILNVISTYEQTFGQRVNFDKLLLYFSTNVVEADQVHVASFLRVCIALTLETYLGLPMIVGRNKNRAFQHYLDKLQKQLDSWSLRLFSMRVKKDALRLFCKLFRCMPCNAFFLPLNFVALWRDCLILFGGRIVNRERVSIRVLGKSCV